MDYGRFVKKLAFPAGFRPPGELRYEDVVATAITRSHLHDDVAGIGLLRHAAQRSSLLARERVSVLAALLLERRDPALATTSGDHCALGGG